MKIQNPAVLLPLVLAALVLGVAGGWIRLGSSVIPLPEAGGSHGLLLVGGFLGTLISVERAMVMKKKAWLIVPFLSGISTLFFLIDLDRVGMAALLAGSLGLSVIMHFQTVRHLQFQSALGYLGAACWFIGNFLSWHFGMIAAGSTWWIGFLLFPLSANDWNQASFCPSHPGPKGR